MNSARLADILTYAADTIDASGYAIIERKSGVALQRMLPGNQRLQVSIDSDLAADIWSSGRQSVVRSHVVLPVRRDVRDELSRETLLALVALQLPDGHAGVSVPQRRELSKQLGPLVRMHLAHLEDQTLRRAFARAIRASSRVTVTRDLTYHVAREVRQQTQFAGSFTVWRWSDRDASLRQIARLNPRGRRSDGQRHSSVAWSSDEAHLVASDSASSYLVSKAASDSQPSARPLAVTPAHTRVVAQGPVSFAQALLRMAATVMEDGEYTVLVTPLRSQGELLGAHVLAAPCSDAFAEADAAATTRLGEVLVPALLRDRELVMELTYLETAAQFDAPAGSADDAAAKPLSAVLQSLVQRVRRHLGAQIVTVASYDYRRKTFLTRAVAGVPSHGSAESPPADPALHEVVADAGEHEWHRVSETTSSPLRLCGEDVATCYGVRADVSKRITADDADASIPVGVLLVGYDVPRGRKPDGTVALSQADKEAVQFYAAIAARYIASHSRNVQRSEVDREVRQLYDHLSERHGVVSGGVSPDDVSPDEMVQEILAVGLRLVGGTAGVVAVPCEEHNDLKVLVQERLAPEHQKRHLDYGEGVTGTCAARREPLVIRNSKDPRTWPADVKPIPWVTNSRSEVAVPILGGLADNRLIGVLDVESEVATDAFGVEEVETLTQLARAAALALDLARAFRELRALRNVARRMHSVTTRDDLLQVFLDRLQAITGAYAASIRIASPTGRTLEPAVQAGAPGDYTGAPIAMGDGVNGWVFEHQELCYVPDAANEESFRPYPGLTMLRSREHTRSELCLPVTWRGDQIGVLNLEHVQVDGLAPSRDFARGLAELAGAALYRERSESQAQRARDRQLIQGVTQFAAALAHDIAAIFQEIRQLATSEVREQEGLDAIGALHTAAGHADSGEQMARELLHHAANPAAREELVDIRQLVRDAVADHSAQAPAATFTFRDRVEGAVRVLCDRGWLDWSITQVIKNSLQYGGSRPTIDITLMHPRHDFVGIVIEDDGPGVSQDDLERMFNWGEERRPGGGSRIALSMVQTFLHQMGGQIFAANSVSGTGLVTTIDLPMDDAEPDSVL